MLSAVVSSGVRTLSTVSVVSPYVILLSPVTFHYLGRYCIGLVEGIVSDPLCDRVRLSVDGLCSFWMSVFAYLAIGPECAASQCEFQGYFSR